MINYKNINQCTRVKILEALFSQLLEINRINFYKLHSLKCWTNERKQLCIVLLVTWAFNFFNLVSCLLISCAFFLVNL